MRGSRRRAPAIGAVIALWPTLLLAQTSLDAPPQPPLCQGAITRLGPPPLAAPAADLWPASTFDGARREDAALDDVLTRASGAMGAQSMGAAVLDADGLWSGRAGADDAPLFWWASAGKLAAAVAVLTGRLLPTERVRSMLDLPWPRFDQPVAYGRGLMLDQVPEPGRPLTWIGHSGGASGVKAVMVWSPVDRAYAAVALTGPGSAEAVANALLRTRGRR